MTNKTQAQTAEVHTEHTSKHYLPHKSVALALFFSVILGPVGLLYSSFWGGIVMISLGIVVVSCKQFFPIILVWLISCVWSVGAAETYNKQIIKGLMAKE